MSIVVGLNCKDRIVMASDSQLSGGHVTRTDFMKLHEVRMDNGGVAVIGVAGKKAPFERALCLLSDRLKRGMKDMLRVGDCCEEVRRAVLFQQFEPNPNFGFLVGARLSASSQSCLWKVECGQPAELVDDYAAIGSRASIAMYILKEYWKYAKPDELALYVVDEMKRSRPEDCGGAVSVWAITAKGVERMSEGEKTSSRDLVKRAATKVRHFVHSAEDEKMEDSA